MNARERRNMIRHGARLAARARFTPETDRLERQEAALMPGLDKRTFAYSHDIKEAKGLRADFLIKYQGHPYYDKLVKTSVSSGSIPDSRVSRTDKTDWLHRRQSVRRFYQRRDKLVGYGKIHATVFPAKVMAWAKSKGIAV